MKKENICQTPLSALSENIILVLKVAKDLSKRREQRTQTKASDQGSKTSGRISKELLKKPLTSRYFTKFLYRRPKIYALADYPVPLLDMPNASAQKSSIWDLKMRKNQVKEIQ